MTTSRPGRRRKGRVEHFDEAAGYGTAADDEGGSWFFHCTAIADGSRVIEEGIEIDYSLVPGHAGRWEAHDLRPR